MPSLQVPPKAKLVHNFSNKYRQIGLLAVSFLLSQGSQAKDKTPVPDYAQDGGVYSAETLGRGNTFSSNGATPAAGSENPAALIDSKGNAVYGTALVDIDSDLDQDIAEASDPLDGKVLQYIGLLGEKGVIFFEPLSRMKFRETLDPLAPDTNYRDVEYDANAVGFGGAERMGAGSIGLSFAYLRSAIGVVEKRTGQADKVVFDTADGLRLNIGVRYPTGPAMWGASIQNAPGVLWGKDYKAEFLPVKIRFGNTLQIRSNTYLSVDWERRFYSGKSNAENHLYIGGETFLSDHFIFRAGVFGPDIAKSEKRRVTLGGSIVMKSGAQISYALESFEEFDEKIKRSFVSLQAPFQMDEEDRPSRR